MSTVSWIVLLVFQWQFQFLIIVWLSPLTEQVNHWNVLSNFSDNPDQANRAHLQPFYHTQVSLLLRQMPPTVDELFTHHPFSCLEFYIVTIIGDTKKKIVYFRKKKSTKIQHLDLHPWKLFNVGVRPRERSDFDDLGLELNMRQATRKENHYFK